MADRALRVAIVGAGPSGIYAADALTADGAHSVDIFDRLPAPFGLVRYGVAPDHLSIRSVRGTLEKVFDHPTVRFLGNVEVGRDVTVAELHDHYDAIVFTYGAARDRRLGIPGEDLVGSIAATDLVAWYCGHPEAPRELIEDALAHANAAVVVGVGNVAVDVTRVLAKTVPELDHTDMPQHVLDQLARSTITDVYLLGRRGPVHATFTTKELRELGELVEADPVVLEHDLQLDDASRAALAANRVAVRNVDVLAEWSARAPAGRPRRIHARFWSRPVEIVGVDRVEGVVVERTELDENGAVRGTGVIETVPAQLVVRSVGYRGIPLAGLPFDADRNVVPSEDGRVLRDGAVVTGEYVAGWIKRGPTGIIGTNKKDAAASVASLLADAAGLPRPASPEPAAIDALLAERGVAVVDLPGWQAIDVAEQELGALYGRPRTTHHDRDTMLKISRGTPPA